MSRTLREYERAAQAALEPAVWNYVEAGAADEHTARRNAERFSEIALAPHVLTDVSRVDTALMLFGRRLPHPILLAPVGSLKLFHPDGEAGVARGAAQCGAVYVASTYMTSTLQEVGSAAAGPWWFQLYPQRDRGFTRELIAQAQSFGASAIVVTVDTPVAGVRERQGWNGIDLPDGMEFGVLSRLPSGLRASDISGIYKPELDPHLDWSALSWLIDQTAIPVLVKGLVRRDDAVRAVNHGVSGVIVSNHGGRNLDTLPPAIELLPAIADAIGADVPVLMDGGIRRGTDIVKALARGATAVLIGRPYVWGLAAEGENGVVSVVRKLHTELQMAMALCGVPTLADITCDILYRDERRSQEAFLSYVGTAIDRSRAI